MKKSTESKGSNTQRSQRILSLHKASNKTISFNIPDNIPGKNLDESLLKAIEVVSKRTERSESMQSISKRNSRCFPTFRDLAKKSHPYKKLNKANSLMNIESQRLETDRKKSSCVEFTPSKLDKATKNTSCAKGKSSLTSMSPIATFLFSSFNSTSIWMYFVKFQSHSDGYSHQGQEMI
jgi:hypothetical protein